MLLDLVEYARAPYPWHLAPMGYVREARLIATRARQLEPAWRSHLQATRQNIEASIDLCRQHNTVVVVGSGTLLDIPIDALRRTFGKVVLLDIIQSRATRRICKQWSNVELLTLDATGVAQPVYAAARQNDVTILPKSTPPTLKGQPVDLIISANLLSQLSVIPRSFLQGHCPQIAPARLSAFSRDLVEAHLHWLTQSATHVCLISDVVRIEEANGAAIQTNIVENVDLPAPDEVWDWHIAPKGSVYRDRGVTHRVHAYRDFRPQGLPSATDPAA